MISTLRKLLPSSVCETLEWSELHQAEGKIAECCEALQSLMNCLVVTYKRDPPAGDPGRRHLCSVLGPAALTPSQVQLIHAAEREFVDVVIVCYAALDRSPLSIGERP